MLLSEVILLLWNTHMQLDSKPTKWSVLKETERFQNQVSKCGWKASAVIGFKSNFFCYTVKQEAKQIQRLGQESRDPNGGMR